MDSIIFSLPRELRDMIYTYVLVDDTQFVNTETWWSRNWAPHHGNIFIRNALNPLDPGLCGQFLRTNKAINAEATEILYSGNHFVFRTKADLELAVRLIGASNAKHIRKVVIMFPRFSGKLNNVSYFAMLKSDNQDLLAIKEHCGALKKIRAIMYWSSYVLDNWFKRKILVKVLNQVDARFRALASHGTTAQGARSEIEKLSVTIEMDKVGDYNEEALEIVRGYDWIVQFGYSEGFEIDYFSSEDEDDEDEEEEDDDDDDEEEGEEQEEEGEEVSRGD